MNAGPIRVGVGGWTYEPWRGTFYPDRHPQARELEFAAAHLSAIEINATFYRMQKPDSFAKWAAVTPPGFMFTIKGSRFCTNRRDLGEAAESVERFCAQGLDRLGDKLGPILWQLAATKRFDADEIAAFLDLLPRETAGIPLRHALEPRHESFRDPRFVDLIRNRGAAIVFAHADKFPEIADVTADFVYARLQGCREEEAEGYAPEALDRWAEVAGRWAEGGAPDGLAYAGGDIPERRPRDVFIFFISGAKVRAPAAAMALLRRLGDQPSSAIQASAR